MATLKEKIELANQKATDNIINSNPVWVDILPAGEVINGLDDYTVIHAGPPIEYDDMVMLEKRGMVSACLIEGWAKNEDEAVELIKSGNLFTILAQVNSTVAGLFTVIVVSGSPIIVHSLISNSSGA